MNGWYGASVKVTNGSSQILSQNQWGDSSSGYSQGFIISLIPTATTMEMSIYFGGGGSGSFRIYYVLLG